MDCNYQTRRSAQTHKLHIDFNASRCRSRWTHFNMLNLFKLLQLFRWTWTSGESLPVDESSFWGKSSCWVCDLLFGCQPSCWEYIFIISLLYEASLPVGFLICCLMNLLSWSSLPVLILICCLGVNPPAGNWQIFLLQSSILASFDLLKKSY